MKKLLYFLLLLLLPYFSEAQIQISGYISLQHISGYTFLATLTDYTRGDPANSGACSTAEDKDTMRIYYGDGSSDLLYRSNGKSFPPDTIPGGDSVAPCEKASIFVGQHTFRGSGSYHILCNTGSRLANVNNIPGSISEMMTLSNTLNLGLAGDSISFPIITNPPFGGIACTSQCYSYNMNMNVPASDSLKYSLGACINCPGYYIPSGATIDPVTGEFSWCKPIQTGLYDFAAYIIVYKRIVSSGGVVYHFAVDTMEVEFQVDVQATCPTGINEIINSSGYTIYPNPAKSVINITGADENRKQVTIYNVLGQPVVSTKETEEQFSLNTCGLTSGVYFINIMEETTGRNYTLKFIKE